MILQTPVYNSAPGGLVQLPRAKRKRSRNLAVRFKRVYRDFTGVVGLGRQRIGNCNMIDGLVFRSLGLDRSKGLWV